MKIKHYCGIFGIIGAPRAAQKTYYGLFSLQHRGQESAGIVTADRGRFFSHKAMGLVRNVFSEGILAGLPGDKAIGQVRYSTTGASNLSNAQPLSVECKRGPLAIAHNGNLTNTADLRAQLAERGATFDTTTDSELMLQLLAFSDEPLVAAIRQMMTKVVGAYSLVIMTAEELVAVRDPWGFRPLSLGRAGDAWVVASETCAFDIVGASFVRDIEPGEIVVIRGSRVESHRSFDVLPPPAFCSFEAVYFANPSSMLFGRTVAEIREDMGRALALEHPLGADIVVPILDGGTYAALGYSHATGIELSFAFVRNHYTGRSFLHPDPAWRSVIVNMKLNLIGRLVRGKRVILVDDSIVRGTTGKSRCTSLKEAGAAEVHMLVSCPPHLHPCVYGIDFPDSHKLIAASRSKFEIMRELGLDSLGYLSEEGMVRAILGGLPEGGTKHTTRGNGLCLACYGGCYPTRCACSG